MMSVTEILAHLIGIAGLIGIAMIVLRHRTRMERAEQFRLRLAMEEDAAARVHGDVIQNGCVTAGKIRTEQEMERRRTS